MGAFSVLGESTSGGARSRRIGRSGGESAFLSLEAGLETRLSPIFNPEEL